MQMFKCAVKYNTTREDAAADVNFKNSPNVLQQHLENPFQFLLYLAHRSFVPTFVRIRQKP